MTDSKKRLELQDSVDNELWLTVIWLAERLSVRAPPSKNPLENLLKTLVAISDCEK